MPAHNHTVKCDIHATRDASNSPVDKLLGVSSAGTAYGNGKKQLDNMKSEMIETVGSGQPVENMQPWSALNYIICINGTYPDRSS